MCVSIGGTIHIYKASCGLKDLAVLKELAESGSLTLHGHSLFANAELRIPPINPVEEKLFCHLFLNVKAL